SVLGPGIEVIRHGHRYAVAWPSTHPDTGRPYRWITPDGATALTDIPAPDTLPEPPHAWVAHFTGGRLPTDTARPRLTPHDATHLTDIPTPDPPPELPHAWVAHFTGGELATDMARAGLTTQAATNWLTTRGAGPTCRATARALDRLTRDLTGAAGARH